VKAFIDTEAVVQTGLRLALPVQNDPGQEGMTVTYRAREHAIASIRGVRSCLFAAMLLLVVASQTCVAQVAGEAEDFIFLSNDYIRIRVNSSDDGAGRFGVDSTGGDPLKASDDNQRLIYGDPVPNTSYTTVRIDETNFIFGGRTDTRAGKGQRYGEVLIEPRVTGSEIVCGWIYPGGVVVTQKLSFTQSPSTGYEDTARIEYTILNTDDVSHSVGLRLALDTMLGPNDGAPFRAGDRALTTNAMYTKSELPEYWQAFDSLTNTTLISQGTLLGGELSAPDLMYFTNWGDIADNPWKFRLTEGKDFTRTGEFELDSAVALFWDPVTIMPGQSVTYIAYYGLGGITIVPGVLSLGVTSPSEVTTAKDRLPEFSVVAYINNTGEGKARGVVTEISLPPELRLSPGQAARRELADIEVGDTAQVVWKVRPTTTTPTMTSFSVSVEAINADKATVVRPIRILAPPQLSIDTPDVRLSVINELLTPHPFAFESTIANNGGAVAYRAEASITLPQGLELARGEMPVKPLGYLKPGERLTVKWWVVTRVDNVTLTAQTTVSSSSTDPKTDSATARIPDLEPRIIVSYDEVNDASVGKYISVIVRVANVPDLYEIHFDVAYPKDLLKPISVSRGTLFVTDDYQLVGPTWGTPTIDMAQGVIWKVSGIMAQSATASGEVARLNFKVIGTGDVALRLGNITLLDGSRRHIEYTLVNPTYTVGK